MLSKFSINAGLGSIISHVKLWVANAVTSNGPSTSKTVTGFKDGKITYDNISIPENQVQGSTPNTTLVDDLAKKADIDSPNLTGIPTAPTAEVGTDTTQIATTEYVNSEIEHKMSVIGAMIYKGPIEGGNTGDYGALTPTANKGWTYMVSAEGALDGQMVHLGDIIICNSDNTPEATPTNYATIWDYWDYYPSTGEGVVIGPASATDGDIAVYDGTTGKLIKDTGLNVSDISTNTYVDANVLRMRYQGTNILKFYRGLTTQE